MGLSAGFWFLIALLTLITLWAQRQARVRDDMKERLENTQQQIQELQGRLQLSMEELHQLTAGQQQSPQTEIEEDAGEHTVH